MFYETANKISFFNLLFYSCMYEFEKLVLFKGGTHKVKGKITMLDYRKNNNKWVC